MHDVRDLHRLPRLIEIGKVEHEAARADDDAEHAGAAPEPNLFAGIESARRRLVLGKQAAEVTDPLPVAGLGEVVAHEIEQQHQDTNRKQRPGEVVQILA